MSNAPKEIWVLPETASFLFSRSAGIRNRGNGELNYLLNDGTLRETVECKFCQGSGKDVRYLEDTRDDTCGMCLGTRRRVKP